jgi:RNA polymerase sigma factor (sigma-70 family)
MDEDAELLRRFAETHDDALFRVVVERQVGFVYAVNLRRLRDAHLAADATQAVFIALARKAGQVARGASVRGWLHRSSCYESRNLMRARIHREERERAAVLIGTVADAEAGAAAAAPGALDGVLDEALAELGARDREAILARFFAGKSFAEMGAAMGRTESAARMRVERALERLRAGLGRRGLESSAAVLAGVLPGYAAATLPAGLAASVMVSASAGLAAASGPLAFFFLMTTSQKIILSAAMLSVAGYLVNDAVGTRRLERELGAMAAENARLQVQSRALERDVAALRARPAGAATGEPVAAGEGAAKAGAPTAAASVAEAAPRPGVTRKAPKGWNKNGNNPQLYEVGVDTNEALGGYPSAYAKGKPGADEASFGGMMQTISPDAYRGQRVRLTGFIKTDEVSDGAQLWMRVDGAGDQMLQFDNMQGREPKGTTEWAEHSVVLDVPEAASALNYGFFVNGSGQMWVNGLRIEPVGREVPATNLLGQRSLPTAPRNIEFSPE